MFFCDTFRHNNETKIAENIKNCWIVHQMLLEFDPCSFFSSKSISIYEFIKDL